MRRSDEAFREKVRADLDRFTGTYKADFKKREISLGDEPFEFLGLCGFPFIFIPFIGCTPVKVSPTYLDSYTITLRYSAPRHHADGNYKEEVMYRRWNSCYFGMLSCSSGFGRDRVGKIAYAGFNAGLVGEAKAEMYQSVVRLTLVEANENELRYRRKGKDATGVYDAEGSYAAQLARGNDPKLKEAFREWLKGNEKRSFWTCWISKTCFMCADDIPPDKRILDIDGEMVVRDGEIVLTESVDGREPFTITLKKQ
jgi:hypothetical protein